MNLLLNPFAGTINRGNWWFAQLSTIFLAGSILFVLS